MNSDLEEKIGKLSEEDFIKYDKEVEESLYDREFCYMNDINYTDPDVQKVKEIVYNQLFDNK